jgi:DNA-binding transcriptional LysR family regulator
MHKVWIEAALNGLGAAIAPWHLVAGDVASGRLIAPYGFLHSDYRYVVKVGRPGRRKTEHFVEWLTETIAAAPERQ